MSLHGLWSFHIHTSPVFVLLLTTESVQLNPTVFPYIPYVSHPPTLCLHLSYCSWLHTPLVFTRPVVIPYSYFTSICASARNQVCIAEPHYILYVSHPPTLCLHLSYCLWLHTPRVFTQPVVIPYSYFTSICASACNRVCTAEPCCLHTSPSTHLPFHIQGLYLLVASHPSCLYTPVVIPYFYSTTSACNQRCTAESLKHAGWYPYSSSSTTYIPVLSMHSSFL
jgi:hypothetical protein